MKRIIICLSILFILFSGACRFSADQTPDRRTMTPEHLLTPFEMRTNTTTLYGQQYLDIPYQSLPGVDPNLLNLDIYTPPKSEARPVLVLIHGGGWTMGDKANPDLVNQKRDYFTHRGWVVASLNYRLSPDVQYPAHVQDVASALAWINGNIANYGGDPQRVFLMGHSAGAHLAALVSLDGRYLGAHRMSTEFIKGVILLDGVGYDILPKTSEPGDSPQNMYLVAFGEDPNVWREASPVTYVNGKNYLPPFLIFYVNLRRTGETEARILAEALQNAGANPEWIAADDKNHETINSDIGKPDDAVTLKIEQFLNNLKK